MTVAERGTPPPERVAAVIVTHHPDATLDQTVAAALDQVDRLWIVDNGSGPDVIAHLSRLRDTNPDRIELTFNEQNSGLPAAQNLAIAAALDVGYDWILLLDDDSVPEPGMVATMLRAVASRPDPSRVALVAPRLFDLNLNRFRKMYLSRHAWHVARLDCTHDRDDLVYAIASGSLIRADAMRAVGPLREDFFIDYVDIEYALRLRRAGHRLLLAADTQINHKLGEAQQSNILGQARTFNSHATWRRYLIYRNRLRVWRAYGASFPAFILADAASAIFGMIHAGLFEQARFAQLGAMSKGIWDGLRG